MASLPSVGESFSVARDRSVGERAGVNDQLGTMIGIGSWRGTALRPLERPPYLGGFAQLDPYGGVVARILPAAHTAIDTGSA